MSSSSQYPETYDTITSSDDYARRFSGKVGEWFLKVQEQATLKMLAPYPNTKVLDVGGGHGQLTDLLLRFGCKVTILSSAEECKSRIRSWVDAGSVDFRVGNFLEMPFEGREFDVVISYRLTAHVNHLQEWLAELARVASKAVVIDYPEVRSINYLGPSLFRFKKKIERNTREYVCFREKDLLRMFEPLGFRLGDRYPQYFLPMVLHRILKQPRLSKAAENLFRLTSLYG